MKRNSRGKSLILGLVLGAVAAVLVYRRRSRALVTPWRERRALPSPRRDDLGEPGRNTDARLDEAIEESFPASDPVSIRIE